MKKGKIIRRRSAHDERYAEVDHGPHGPHAAQGGQGGEIKGKKERKRVTLQSRAAQGGGVGLNRAERSFATGHRSRRRVGAAARTDLREGPAPTVGGCQRGSERFDSEVQHGKSFLENQ